ncbi:unnamed protein product [Ceutorhynchus assimilis]|uniref:Uncharacterized protein n=1 Tax=Ceutorhynchus assimilis TaxID=467358 RepID=A0A9P0DFA1_9CUCU|nr:unnamed protein product [Ceutorhynchus assimilis]
MGKRARKTRWRALDIADDHSDSEESNTNSSAVSSRYSRSISNGYYSKYSYSSQSTPARRQRYNPYDGSTKSTRSSSTTSENKITFNEDEYTRITTPRQDVLFKKGYLNKPKSYQTQTSTGNSTISTGNSTENGTPDHQSTDLDYESQFMFPNGFVDQNGIYYVNSYEPYPLMMFNPPTYFQEFSSDKMKRYSTGSLSESMSPNNEEATSQDLSQSGGEASNSGVSDYSGPPVYNMVYPGYYVSGACTPTDLTNGQHHHHYPPEPVKKLKKRRERKSSKTIPGDSSEFTDENSDDENVPLNRVSIAEHQQEAASRVEAPSPTEKDEKSLKTYDTNDQSNSHGCADEKTEKIVTKTNQAQPKSSILKPDAEEFIPRAYHPVKMLPPNFMPIPLVPIGEFGTQNFAPHPAFIPPGFPVNFIPHHLSQKMYPPPVPQSFVSYPPPVVPTTAETKIEEIINTHDDKVVCDDKNRANTATPSHTPVVEEIKSQIHTKTIDIATVVSKLEAVKQQETIVSSEETIVINKTRPTKPHHNFKRNFYAKYRDSPVKSGEATPQTHHNNEGSGSQSLQNSPYHFKKTLNEAQIRVNYHRNEAKNGFPLLNGTRSATPEYSRQVTNSPERFQQKKSWKPYQNNTGANYKKIQPNYQKPLVNGKISSEKNPVASEAKPEIGRSPAKSIKEAPKANPNNSQWISVSNRKKKKNKNVEEDFDVEDPINESAESDLFESYDVNQLVDVVPPSNFEPQEESQVKKIESILTSIAQNEAQEVSTTTEICIPEVSDIEKIIIEEQLKVEVVEQKNKDEEKVAVKESTPVASVEEVFKSKKRSKKGTQKPLLKKVIITDIFNDEPKIPVEKKVVTVEDLKPMVSTAAPVKVIEEPVEESTAEIDVAEKKSKKKKKTKSNKTYNNENNNDSTKSLPTDDSYEVLLENTIASGENVEEISLELDKLIQKGMYNSFQENIKTLNVEPEADAFFKTIGSTLAGTSKDKSVAASGSSTKTPDFNRIFQSTRQFLKPNMVSVERDIKVDVDRDNNKACSSTVDAADPSRGLVVDNSTNTTTDDEKLYPITQAVKEWMSKTREATPEIEILKSPSIIQKELLMLNLDDDEDELTLFSSCSSTDNDLLEYWENEITSPLKDCDGLYAKDIDKICANVKSCDKCRTDSIKTDGGEDDEEIAVYESKYGKNEAFLSLQKENGQPRPEHFLPNRAVCCSLQ